MIDDFFLFQKLADAVTEISLGLHACLQLGRYSGLFMKSA